VEFKANCEIIMQSLHLQTLYGIVHNNAQHAKTNTGMHSGTTGDEGISNIHAYMTEVYNSKFTL